MLNTWVLGISTASYALHVVFLWYTVVLSWLTSMCSKWYLQSLEQRWFAISFCLHMHRNNEPSLHFILRILQQTSHSHFILLVQKPLLGYENENVFWHSCILLSCNSAAMLHWSLPSIITTEWLIITSPTIDIFLEWEQCKMSLTGKSAIYLPGPYYRFGYRVKLWII